MVLLLRLDLVHGYSETASLGDVNGDGVDDVLIELLVIRPVVLLKVGLHCPLW